MLVCFYSALNSSTSKLKEDKSVFTIADGTVQHLLIEHLFGGKFASVVGEEECEVNLSTKPYTVDGLKIPDEFCAVVEAARDEVRALAAAHLPAAAAAAQDGGIRDSDCDSASASASVQGAYGSLSAFIDPIDGTREFASGALCVVRCTLCVCLCVHSCPCPGATSHPLPLPLPPCYLSWPQGWASSAASA